MVVATAAPVSPSWGNGPRPKMRHGSRMMLIRLAIPSDRMAIDGSPAPRKTALIRKIKKITMLVANITRV